MVVLVLNAFRAYRRMRMEQKFTLCAARIFARIRHDHQLFWRKNAFLFLRKKERKKKEKEGGADFRGLEEIKK